MVTTTARLIAAAATATAAVLLHAFAPWSTIAVTSRAANPAAVTSNNARRPGTAGATPRAMASGTLPTPKVSSLQAAIQPTMATATKASGASVAEPNSADTPRASRPLAAACTRAPARPTPQPATMAAA